MNWSVQENHSLSFRDHDFSQNGSTELMHYGVKGMKWGVRKEYELKGRKTAGKDSTSKVKLKGSESETIRFYDETNKKVDFDIIDMIKEAQPNRYASHADRREAFAKLQKNKGYVSEEQQLYNTNHNGPSDIRRNNCFECSMAYEMRRRGYDVQAKEMMGGFAAETRHAFDVKDGFRIKLSPDSYSSKEDMARSCYSKLYAQCMEYGEGARGCLDIQYWEVEGGHSMMWEVKNGEFRIIDSQSDAQAGYTTFLHMDAEEGVGVYRLDNAEVLPGVTDFVEPFERTEKEKREVKNARQYIEDQTRKANEEEKRWESEPRLREDEKRKVDGMNFVEKTIYKIGKATKEVIDKSKTFVNNLFKNSKFNEPKKSSQRFKVRGY